jgi:hypothetical protein
MEIVAEESPETARRIIVRATARELTDHRVTPTRSMNARTATVSAGKSS